MAEFEVVAAELIASRPEVMAACRETLTALLVTTEIDERLEKAAQEAEKISRQVKDLISQQSRGVVEGFSERYGALEKRFNTVQERISRLETEKADREYRTRQAQVFLETLQGAKLGDDGLFVALVDRVVIGQRLIFILRDGSEWMAG